MADDKLSPSAVLAKARVARYLATEKAKATRRAYYLAHAETIKARTKASAEADPDRTDHVDHIKALARGGSNWPSNLQLTCGPCNNRKRAIDPIEFARRNGRLI